MHPLLIQRALGAVALSLLAGVATAGDFYVLGALGQSSASDGFRNDYAAGYTASGFSKSVSDADAYKLQVGYQVNPYFAVEGGYVNLGTWSTEVRWYGTLWIPGNISQKGVNLSLLGKYPLSQDLSVFAKVGSTALHTDSNANSSNSSSHSNSVDLQAGLGVGAIYQLSEHLALRGEWERVSQDAKMLSVGLQYHF